VIRLLPSGREEARAGHCIFADKDGDRQRNKSLLLNHVVKGKAKHSLMQPHAIAGEDVTARTSHLHAALKVREFKMSKQFKVRAGFEALVCFKTHGLVKPGWVPCLNLLVVFAGSTNGNIFIRWERNLQEDGLQFGIDIHERGFKFGNLGFKSRGLGLERIELGLDASGLIPGSFFEFASKFTDAGPALLGDSILIGPEGFHLRHDAAASLIKREQTINISRDPLLGAPVFEELGIFA